MNRLSSPMRVTPSSCTVPRLTVQNSRNTLSIADLEPRRLAGVFLVLRVARRSRRTGRSRLSRADARRALDHDVRADARAGADHDLGADHRERADLDVRAQLAPRGRPRRAGRSRAASPPAAQLDRDRAPAACSALAADVVADQSPRSSCFQMPRMLRSSFASRISWSPGTTGRRKRALSMPTK